MSFAVPHCWNQVAHVRRNALKFTEVSGSTHCLPFGHFFGFAAMMPARTAAGQMCLRRKFLVLIGVSFCDGKIRADKLMILHAASSSVIDFGSHPQAREPGVLGSLMPHSASDSSMRSLPAAGSKSS